MKPYALFHQNEADHALDELDTLAQRVHGHQRHAGEPRQAEGQRHGAHPDKAGIEEERNHGFAAGAQRVIAGVQEGVHGHEGGAHAHQVRGQRAHFIRRVVNRREERRGGEQQHTQPQAAEHRKHDHARIGLARFFHFARAQLLAHHDAHGHAQRHIDHVENVENGGGNVRGGHGLQPAHGIALVQNGRARGPEDFVVHQGHALHKNLFCQAPGDVNFAVHAMHEAVAHGVRVRPARDHGQFHKAGKHRGDGRAAHFQPREAHAAENQEIIEREIDQNGRHARHHGHDGLPGFAQRTGIHLHDHKGEQAPQHYAHIVQAVLQRNRPRAGRGG